MSPHFGASGRDTILSVHALGPFIPFTHSRQPSCPTCPRRELKSLIYGPGLQCLLQERVKGSLAQLLRCCLASGPSDQQMLQQSHLCPPDPSGKVLREQPQWVPLGFFAKLLSFLGEPGCPFMPSGATLYGSWEVCKGG